MWVFSSSAILVGLAGAVPPSLRQNFPQYPDPEPCKEPCEAANECFCFGKEPPLMKIGCENHAKMMQASCIFWCKICMNIMQKSCENFSCKNYSHDFCAHDFCMKMIHVHDFCTKIIRL